MVYGVIGASWAGLMKIVENIRIFRYLSAVFGWKFYMLVALRNGLKAKLWES